MSDGESPEEVHSSALFSGLIFTGYLKNQE